MATMKSLPLEKNASLKCGIFRKECAKVRFKDIEGKAVGELQTLGMESIWSV